jgi:hypothetical protein
VIKIQEKLRDIIKEKGLSIYQVAKGIGVDHANLYRSLGDGSNLESNTMTRVLDFLGYEIQFVESKERGQNKMKFKVDDDFNLVSYNLNVWSQFPDPGKQNRFQLMVRNDEYTTWKRNLKSKCTSFARIEASNKKWITHREFCSKYGLRRGADFEVEVIKLFKIYRLIV